MNTAMKSEGLCVGRGACTGEGFDQHAMLALVEGVLTDGKAGGFDLTHFWANEVSGLRRCACLHTPA